MAKGPIPSQSRIIARLENVIGWYGYKVQKRKKDPKGADDAKAFYPDLIADKITGKGRRFYEVEATVTNNTVFKSLMGLLQGLSIDNKLHHAYLVVPDKKREFAEQCVKLMKGTIRKFGKRLRGANPKINLEVVTFEEVSECNNKLEKWSGNGKVGAKPKCRFAK